MVVWGVSRGLTVIIFNADASLLQTVCFVPGETKPLNFPLIQPDK